MDTSRIKSQSKTRDTARAMTQQNVEIVRSLFSGGKRSGVTVEEREETWVFTVQHAAITHVREYATKEAALEAAGHSL